MGSPFGSLASTVHVTGGTGRGGADLTAFDAALQDAGIHDANLVRISSITPAGAERTRSTAETLAEHIEPGAYHPAVYASERSASVGDRIHAAVAGMRLDAGYGINVEHHGLDTDAERVRRDCRAMLDEMADRRDTEPAEDMWMHVETATVAPGDEWVGVVAAILYTG